MLRNLDRLASFLLLTTVCACAAQRASDPATLAEHWIQAPFSSERDGSAVDGSRPMPVFRHEFTLRRQPIAATFRIAGLGQWTATMDGAPIAPNTLHQAWTDYHRTITCETYPLTLATGRHAIAILLGNGMYNVQKTKGRYTKFEGSFGPPKLTAEIRLRYRDGTSEVIATDAAWKTAPGPVTFSSTYGGEDYDAQALPAGWTAPGFDDSGWARAKATEGPGGTLIAALAPEVHVAHEFSAPKATTAAPGITIYDLGQNIAGWPRIRVQGSAGAVLRLTPGELLKPGGMVSQSSSGGPQWWTYTLRGGAPEEWSPGFSYYGFRYVQAEWVSGPEAKILSLTGQQLSSDSAITGTFESSSARLNAIHTLIVEAMHNNEVSLFTDCPHREKLGWLEETHLVAPGLLFNNDLRGLMRATDRNMADAQKPDGMVPTIAPQYTSFGPKYAIFDDSPEWGSTSILAPWTTYRFYGDTDELARAYPTMQAYLKFLEGKAQDGIVAYGLGDWYDIGPGGPGFGKQTTLGVTGTLMLYEDAAAMGKIATLLHHAADASTYRALAEREKLAFHKHFWNEAQGFYDTGSQTANAMPLALGVVPEDKRAAVLAHVIADIHTHNDHVTTGEVGYPYMVRALMQAGRSDVVLAMMLRSDAPSYGSQLAAGATSLTEAWDANPKSSQDHFMLGGAEEWFYRGLAGIDLDLSRENKSERIIIRPAIVDGVGSVHATYVSSLGRIASAWTREAKVTTMAVTVPATSTVYVPARPGDMVHAPRARLLRHEANAAVYEVDAGTCAFRITTP